MDALAAFGATEYLAWSDKTRDFWAPYTMAMGAFYGVWGIYSLASDGPVESSFRAYQKGAGRTIKPANESVLGHLHVGAVRGGAVAGFSGTF